MSLDQETSPVAFEDSNRTTRFCSCVDDNLFSLCKIKDSFQSKKKNEQILQTPAGLKSSLS